MDLLNAGEELAKDAHAVSQIAPITSTIPAASATEGTWPSTIGAHHGGGDGQQREHDREAVARQPAHRELLERVGDDARGDADDDGAPGDPGVLEDAPGAPGEERREHERAERHPGGEAVLRAQLGDLREAVAEHDVGGPEHAGGERVADAGEAARDVRAAEQADAGDERGEADDVAPAPRAQRGDRDRADELDRDRRAQVEARDRQVEGGVHQPDHDAEGEREHEPARRPRALPRPAPRAQRDRGDEHAQPGERRGRDRAEEQHGDAGARVLRGRPEDEQELRRRERGAPPRRRRAHRAQSTSGVSTIPVGPAAWRSARSGAYSGESYQRRAASCEGNSMIAMPSGGRSPSSTSRPRPDEEVAAAEALGHGLDLRARRRAIESGSVTFT